MILASVHDHNLDGFTVSSLIPKFGFTAVPAQGGALPSSTVNPTPGTAVTTTGPYASGAWYKTWWGIGALAGVAFLAYKILSKKSKAA